MITSFKIFDNLQLADKLYFKTGELTPRDKELILSITGGDNYTKLIADAFHHFKTFEENKEEWNPNSLKMMKTMYGYLVVSTIFIYLCFYILFIYFT